MDVAGVGRDIAGEIGVCLVVDLAEIHVLDNVEEPDLGHEILKLDVIALPLYFAADQESNSVLQLLR